MSTGPSLRSALRIRDAVPKDAGPMARVFVESWRTAYAGLLPERVVMRMSIPRMGALYARELRRQRPGDFHLVATRENGDIVGLAHGGLIRDRGLRVSGAAVEGEIYTLYVHPDAQGEGAGLCLMEALFGGFRLAGLRTAGLWMVQGNPTRFFYERVGGRKIAEKLSCESGHAVTLEAYGWSALVTEPRRLSGS